MVNEIKNKFQRAVIAAWPVAVLIVLVVFPLEAYHVWQKQKETK